MKRLDRIISETIKRFIAESSFKNNQGYNYFAVNKNTGKIANGWDCELPTS